MRPEQLGMAQATPEWPQHCRIGVSTARVCGPSAQTCVDSQQTATNLRLPTTYLGNIGQDLSGRPNKSGTTWVFEPEIRKYSGRLRALS